MVDVPALGMLAMVWWRWLMIPAVAGLIVLVVMLRRRQQQ